MKTLRTGYKAYKASKYTKAALGAQKSVKAIQKVSVKAKPTIVPKISAKGGTKPLQSVKAFRQIKQQQKSASKIGCFTAGTKVYTEKGFKNIEAIKTGDYVWSENPETKEKALKKVNKIFVREKDSIIRLSINGETIETTHEHPFYVEGIGFVAAKHLKAGTAVRLESGETAYVESFEEIRLSEPIRVYNFEVADFHTYYVSEQKVLVHNTCAEPMNRVSVHVGKSGTQKYVVGAYKDIKGIEGMDAHHVGQAAIMKRLVTDFDYNTAPAISVPVVGHRISSKSGIVSRTTTSDLTARQLIARDIRELRRVYPDIPNSALRELIILNKKTYKEMGK